MLLLHFGGLWFVISEFYPYGFVWKYGTPQFFLIIVFRDFFFRNLLGNDVSDKPNIVGYLVITLVMRQTRPSCLVSMHWWSVVASVEHLGSRSVGEIRWNMWNTEPHPPRTYLTWVCWKPHLGYMILYISMIFNLRSGAIWNPNICLMNIQNKNFVTWQHSWKLILVGALEHLDYLSHHIGNHNSNWRTPSFFRGLYRSTTNQSFT